MSRMGLNDPDPSLLSSTLRLANYPDTTMYDTGTAPTPEKPTGVDTLMKSSSESPSRNSHINRHEDENHLNIIDQVTAALHRSDDEGASDEEGRVRINIHVDSGVEGSDTEESDENEDPYSQPNKRNDTKENVSDESSGGDTDNNDTSHRPSQSATPDSIPPPSALQTTMPVPPPTIIATSPAVPDITLSPPTSTVLARPDRRISLAQEPLAYNFRSDQLSREKMTYICANAKPYWENGSLVTCERVQEKRLGESLKCVECGSPVLYKARTKRMVQFEAR